ncbi:MAG: BON domain-containing protein [Chloroflexi bacterium]|nr:BON domain-containing protein [Chloroflexota bacterium]
MKRDEEIRLRIMDELRWETGITNPVAIGVAVRDAIVTLSGYVDNFSDAMAAEETAASIPEVRGVVQNIRVRSPSQPERNDFDLAEAACAAIALNPAVPPDQVKVVVRYGRVTLVGEVQWPRQKEEAGSTVRSVHGAKEVTNDITVKPRLAPSDVKGRIVKAFERMVAHHVSHLDITVQDGKITLSGTVHALIEKLEAEKIAREMPGITEVENRLTIYPLAEEKEKLEGEERFGAPAA